MRPLSDVRIVAIEQYGAGPFGSMHLADLGAEVIKIEDPRSGGDFSRYVPPYAEERDSLFFEAFNRNKRSIALDLTTEAGRSVFERLVSVSDVVYSNLRGNVPRSLGITYEDLKHINPKIVCVSLSGYGASGPRSRQPGYDYVLQALGGWMSLTGEPGSPPAKSGLSLVDYTGGLVAAMTVLSGLHQARRDGEGMDCDVSLFDVSVSMLTYPAIWALNGDWKPERKSRSAHPSLVPFQAFAASDGWFVVSCAKEKFFRYLIGAVGLPELAEDPRFSDFDARLRNQSELVEILDRVFATRTVDEWVDLMAEAGVPSGAVQDVDTALSDPQTLARGLIVETEHPRFGLVRQVRSAVRVGNEDDIDYRRGPRLNEDEGYVLVDVLEMSQNEIEEFRHPSTT